MALLEQPSNLLRSPRLQNLDRPRVFFWQNMPSHHQIGALGAFARDWGAPVSGVWCSDISAERKAHGWSSARHEAVRDVFLPAEGWERRVDEIIDENLDAIHMFSGIGPYPGVTRAAHRLAARAAAPRMGLIVEPGEMWTWKKWIRVARAIKCYWNFRSRVSAVFAMGQQGVDFYRSIGFRDECLYPYLYQTDATPVGDEPCDDNRWDELDPTVPVRLTYVGQLVRRKGVDTLVRALGRIPNLPWSLDIYGDGADRSMLHSLAEELGVSNRIHFHGFQPAATVSARLRDAHISVVPSRFDGWGMATNEALQAGLCAIVSDRASSSVLVQASRAGTVFRAEDDAALARDIAERISDRRLLSRERSRAVNFSHRLESRAVGRYLRQSMEHAFLGRGSRPEAPWSAAGVDSAESILELYGSVSLEAALRE